MTRFRRSVEQHPAVTSGPAHPVVRIPSMLSILLGRWLLPAALLLCDPLRGGTILIDCGSASLPISELTLARTLPRLPAETP